jgi:hypothetical protein
MMSATSVISAAAGLPAWRPFLDPISLPGGSWWFTLIPMAVLISMVYKAVRVRSMDHYVANVVVMSVQIVVAMFLFAVAANLLVIWIVPALGG